MNETLPIVLDRSLGGGWPAVVGSTALIGRCPLCPLCSCVTAAMQPIQNFLTPDLQSSSEKLYPSQSVCAMGCRLEHGWHPLSFA